MASRNSLLVDTSPDARRDASTLHPRHLAVESDALIEGRSDALIEGRC
jgi:hypothetical protein